MRTTRAPARALTPGPARAARWRASRAPPPPPDAPAASPRSAVASRLLRRLSLSQQFLQPLHRFLLFAQPSPQLLDLRLSLRACRALERLQLRLERRHAALACLDLFPQLRGLFRVLLGALCH